MIDLTEIQSIENFVKYAKIREGEAVAEAVREELLAMQADIENTQVTTVDGFDVMVPIIDELKPGQADEWLAAGEKRVYSSVRPKAKPEASTEN